MNKFEKLVKSNTDSILQEAKKSLNIAILAMIRESNHSFSMLNVPRNRLFQYSKDNWYSNKSGRFYDFKCYFEILDEELVIKVQNLFICTQDCILDNRVQTEQYIAEAKHHYSKSNVLYFNIPAGEKFKQQVFKVNDIFNYFYIEDFTNEDLVLKLEAVENALLGHNKKTSTEEQLYAQLQEKGIDIDIITIKEKVTEFKSQGLPQVYWFDVLSK